jgi:hypothetical protein
MNWSDVTLRQFVAAAVAILLTLTFCVGLLCSWLYGTGFDVPEFMAAGWGIVVGYLFAERRNAAG